MNISNKKVVIRLLMKPHLKVITNYVMNKNPTSEDTEKYNQAINATKTYLKYLHK